MSDTSKWVEIALAVVKKEAGDSIYSEYRETFKEIAEDQAQLRVALAAAESTGDQDKIKEYRDAYEATLLNIKNVMKMKQLDLSNDTMDAIARVLRTAFRVFLMVAAG